MMKGIKRRALLLTCSATAMNMIVFSSHSHGWRGAYVAGCKGSSISSWKRYFSSDLGLDDDDSKGTKANEFGIKTSSYAIMGRREYMEDEHVISADRKLAGVFDGHGGPLVSKYIHQTLEKYFAGAMDGYRKLHSVALPSASLKTGKAIDGEAVKSIFETVTKQIDDEVCQQRNMRRQGSTFCSVYINRDEHVVPADFANTNTFPYSIVSCNIGDSRAVLSRGGKAIDLTYDHKPELPAERSRVEKMGGYLKWDGDMKNGKPIPGRGVYRVNGNLALSRAIGDLYERPYVCGTPDITVHQGDWRNDEFVIIATDGFWDIFDSESSVVFVKEILKMAVKEEEGVKAGKELKLPADLKKENTEMEATVQENRLKARELLGSNFDTLETALATQDLDKIEESLLVLSKLKISDEDRNFLVQMQEYQKAIETLNNSLVKIAKKNMAKYLTIEAYRNGSYDNISVVVVWLKDTIPLN